MAAVETPGQVIERLNDGYAAVHRGFEDEFWATKMALKSADAERYNVKKNEYEAFLSDASNLTAVRAQLAEGIALDASQKLVLQNMEKTFLCYIMEHPEAKALKEQLSKEEYTLENDVRGAMSLGYTDPKTGEWVKASSALLKTIRDNSKDEAERKAVWEQGFRAIGPHVAEQFAKVVKMRNKLAKMLGYVDFYDYKVTNAEGFGKDKLFSILDELEERSRPCMEQVLKDMAADNGAAAIEPWNITQALLGESVVEQDPYFPFDLAVSVWARSYAGMGIKYKGATMNLDLCDRDGKYSNGFCHWPQCAYVKADGTFVPSQTNFTSLATPSKVGSGYTAMTTLMHEGGHAAHFANVEMPSPFFSQERAPTSVAYAENQSMFLDSLVDDAAWLARYAVDKAGNTVPWELVEKGIRERYPRYKAYELRSMIAVPYFEKALYELPDEQVTAANILALADEVDKRIMCGVLPGRPLLSVPHILSDESSCYYHGYVLAQMSVEQTRAFFLRTEGSIVDNPKVGPALAEHYWKPGNSEAFLDLVERLTGAPLNADAWITQLNRDVEEVVACEKKEYDAALKAGPAVKDGEEFDLGMRMRLLHGDEVIADSQNDGFAGASAKFVSWIPTAFPPEK